MLAIFTLRASWAARDVTSSLSTTELTNRARAGALGRGGFGRYRLGSAIKNPINATDSKARRLLVSSFQHVHAWPSKIKTRRRLNTLSEVCAPVIGCDLVGLYHRSTPWNGSDATMIRR